jgi:hypothetical protein
MQPDQGTARLNRLAINRGKAGFLVAQLTRLFALKPRIPMRRRAMQPPLRRLTMSEVESAFRREIDELQEEVGAWLESVSRRHKPDHAERLGGYLADVSILSSRIVGDPNIDVDAVERLLELASAIGKDLYAAMPPGSHKLNEALANCLHALAGLSPYNRHSVALVLLMQLSSDLRGISPARASERPH